jgi:hypothetical protein
VAHLALALLGPFQATLDGERVQGLNSDYLRALLAYLAVEATGRIPVKCSRGCCGPCDWRTTAWNCVGRPVRKSPRPSRGGSSVSHGVRLVWLVQR